MLKLVWINQIQQYIKRIIHHNQATLYQECKTGLTLQNNQHDAPQLKNNQYHMIISIDVEKDEIQPLYDKNSQ